MGGFSDNYECGYWGDETPPMKMSQKLKDAKESSSLDKDNLYIKRSDSKYSYLNVMLTPISLLTDNEQEERTNLTQLCNMETALELIEDEHKNLKIYYDEVFIGLVQKVFKDKDIDHTNIVNNFCFEGDEEKGIQAFWSGDFFLLKEKVKPSPPSTLDSPSL